MVVPADPICGVQLKSRMHACHYVHIIYVLPWKLCSAFLNMLVLDHRVAHQSVRRSCVVKLLN